MEWLFVVVTILSIVGVAFLIGWAEKNIKNRAAKASIWIGAILLLLAICFWDDHPFAYGIILSAVILHALEQIPVWLIYTVAALCFTFLVRYILILIVQSLADIGVELERTNARIVLMENSINDKLDGIRSGLLRRDEQSDIN